MRQRTRVVSARRCSALLLSSLLVLLTACGGKDEADPPEKGGPVDATVSPIELTRIDGGFIIGNATIDAAPYEGPLEVHLQVNGQNGSCGSCGVILAQVKGGKAPYEYKWSDPTLQGPGPHTVCPKEVTTYNVEVTDSSERVSVELSAAAQTAADSQEFKCSKEEGVWGGCFAPGGGDAGAPPVDICKTLQIKDPLGLGINLSEEFPIAFSGEINPTGESPFIPGKLYEFIYDQLLLTFSLSKAVTVKIYGSDTSCGTDQLFGTWTLDGRQHQGYCFTPEKAWKYTRVDIDIGDTLLYVDFIPAQGTLCRGCSNP